MAWEAAVMKGMREHKLIQLIDSAGRAIIGEPYMLYKSDRGTFSVYLYQRTADDNGIAVGWRSIEYRQIEDAKATNEQFTPRRDTSSDPKHEFATSQFMRARTDFTQDLCTDVYCLLCF
jgi:hypothetical protein